MAQVRCHTHKNFYCHPDKMRNYTGFIHLVLKNPHEIPEWKRNVAEFLIEDWVKLRNIKHPEIVVSYHRCNPWEHFHVLFWHFRACRQTEALMRKIRESGWVFSWRPARCFECARWYVRVGRGGKEVLYPQPGSDPTSRAVSDEECPTHGTFGEYDGEEEADLRLESTSDQEDLHGAYGIVEGRGRVPKPTGGRGAARNLEQLDWARDIIRARGVQDYNSFAQVIVEQNDKELLDFHCLSELNPMYNKIIETQIRAVKMSFRRQTWQECLYYVNNNWRTLDYGVKFMSLNESIHFLHYWCEENEKDIGQFVRNLKKIMDREVDKYNLLYLQGDSNAFKSKICTSIVRSVVWGSTISGIDKYSIRFAWQGAINDRVLYWDECKQTDSTAEVAKSVMGGETINVDVKYMSQQRLQRVPVLASSNEPMWYGVSPAGRDSFERAIRARGETIECRAIVGGQHIEGEIDPRVWGSLLCQYTTPTIGGGYLPVVQRYAADYRNWLKARMERRFEGPFQAYHAGCERTVESPMDYAQFRNPLDGNQVAIDELTSQPGGNPWASSPIASNRHGYDSDYQENEEFDSSIDSALEAV